jgi:manganese transport protein
MILNPNESMNPLPNETNPPAQASAVSRSGDMSLEGLHDSVKVPHHKAGFWKQIAAFFGPAVLVSVAYMDPGKWGTDLQAGAQFKYGLLWVVGLASVMAIFLQIIAARLGIATGRNLAQCCYDWYPKWTRVPNWLMAELAIIACDLAEVLGGAHLWVGRHQPRNHRGHRISGKNSRRISIRRHSC